MDDASIHHQFSGSEINQKIMKCKRYLKNWPFEKKNLSTFHYVEMKSCKMGVRGSSMAKVEVGVGGGTCISHQIMKLMVIIQI